MSKTSKTFRRFIKYLRSKDSKISYEQYHLGRDSALFVGRYTGTFHYEPIVFRNRHDSFNVDTSSSEIRYSYALPFFGTRRIRDILYKRTLHKFIYGCDSNLIMYTSYSDNDKIILDISELLDGVNSIEELDIRLTLLGF